MEMAQCEGLLRAMDWTWVYAGLTKRDRPKTANRDPVFSPSGVFRCKDGFVALVAGTDTEFRGLSRMLGQPGLVKDRRKSAGHLNELIQAWCEKLTRSEIQKIARRHRVPAAPVTTGKDHYESRHLRARRSVWEHEDSVYGTMVEYGPAPKLSATPARIKWAGKPVGFHNEFILKKVLGLSDEEIRSLEAKGVVGKWADRMGAKPPDGWKGEGALL